MRNKSILFVCIACWLISCSAPKRFATDYYTQNEKTLVRMEESFRALYSVKPFSIEFSDKTYNYISMEFITDSLKYVYEFYLDEPMLKDSLQKFGYNSEKIAALIEDMRSINCTWINNMDYYSEGTKKSMVFMSVRPKALDLPFSSKKYYILTFYSQPQYYDSNGDLLDNRKLRRLRRVHGEIFRRINDKVCYSLSERFR